MKHIIYSIAISIFLFNNISIAQVGDDFPGISGTSIAGEDIELPKAAKGKKTIIVMAYSEKAEEPLKTWIDPIHRKFIAKNGMFDKDLDVNVYFVALFSGANKLKLGPAMKRSKEKIDEPLHKYIFFYKGEIKTYKKLFGLEKDKPYCIMLDENGKITYLSEGPCTDTKMDTIDDLARK